MMDHAQSTQPTNLHGDFTFVKRLFSSLFHEMRGRGATPCLISLCLVLLLGLPGRSQSTTADRLSPGDRIELHVWHWTALRGGVLEGLQLNQDFSIDPAGRLDLPNIGGIGAAGLRTDELAKLIADRLQARSGLPERPETTVQRVLNPAMEATASVESTGHQAAPKQAQDLKKQRQKAKALALDLEAARRVIEGFKAKIIAWGNEKAAMLAAERSAEASQAAQQRVLDEERHKAELLRQKLASSRQTIDALETGANLAAVEQANAIKDRQVAEAALKQAGEALALERQRADAAARDLDSVRKERDASREAAAVLSAALEQERERSIG